ncbi:MAG: uroporphyrinogen-III synthase [Paracoccus sp. (in: a-proteobacteria)]|nr:uroporphyrinogen-III synthase [Paracoccus sp. (in: a-proteobacteria)]
MSAPLCLLTRPEPLSAETAAALPGIDCLIAPILRVVALSFDAAMVADAPGLVLTSVNAVPHAGPGRGRPAVCVGPQTAAAARAAGFDVTEGPGDAEGMLPLLAGRGDWLHLHGRHRARVLPVRGVAVYDQQALPLEPAARAALHGQRALIVPLFSPRSAQILSDAVMAAVPAVPVATIAISARADACWHVPVAHRVIAARPERGAMLAAIREAAQTERSGLPWVEAARGGR